MSNPAIAFISQFCTPSAKRLESQEAAALMPQLSGWTITGEVLTKSFQFKNYYETMAFINAAAWIAHQEDHHPDIAFGYNQCVIKLSTHSVKGISINDYICAAKIDS